MGFTFIIIIGALYHQSIVDLRVLPVSYEQARIKIPIYATMECEGYLSQF